MFTSERPRPLNLQILHNQKKARGCQKLTLARYLSKHDIGRGGAEPIGASAADKMPRRLSSNEPDTVPGYSRQKQETGTISPFVAC